MSIYWQIIPLGDGYNYLTYENGDYTLCSKMNTHINTSLMFKSKEECLEYIEKHLDLNTYREEEVFLNEKYYKI